jgi:ribosome assembly protein 1
MDKAKYSMAQVVSNDSDESVTRFWTALTTSLTSASRDPCFEECALENTTPLQKRVIAFGPNSDGPNMLLISSSCKMTICGAASLSAGTKDNTVDTFLFSASFAKVWERFHSAITTGFQLLSASGPLMQEPLYGVCFVIENIKITARCSGLLTSDIEMLQNDIGSGDISNIELPELSESVSISTGQLISEIKDAFSLSLLSAPLRIVEPIFKCTLQCDQGQLGNLYSVLSRRRGEATDTDIIEGTQLFIVSAILPVASSFGFSQELLKKTSGSATAPQLLFSHWQLLQDDPFWKPTTDAELEDFGSIGSTERNICRQFIETVRKRKGLPVEEKLVIHAEKQRNISKNK